MPVLSDSLPPPPINGFAEGGFCKSIFGTLGVRYFLSVLGLLGCVLLVLRYSRKERRLRRFTMSTSRAEKEDQIEESTLR